MVIIERKMFAASLLVISASLLNAYGQRILNCVIPSLCNDEVYIDPRILTPTSTPSIVNDNCPTGYIPCLDFKCGVGVALPDDTESTAIKGAFPWHTFLQNADAMDTKNGYAGGGVLIDQYFVLTAAHKIANLTNVNVILGVYDSSDLSNTQTSKVSSIYIHSNYDQRTLKNDIALLMLETPMNFDNNVNELCLPATGKSYQNKSTGCTVSGFGQTNFAVDDAPTAILKQVRVPIVDTNVCRKSFSSAGLLGSNVDLYLDVENEICAGGEAGKDACTQDGGSPLTCYDSTKNQSELVGLVIWGKNCGQSNVYGVYVNVPSYTAWIECTEVCMLTETPCASCPAKKT